MDTSEIFKLINKETDDPDVQRICREIITWERGEIDKNRPQYRVFLERLLREIVPEVE